MVIAVLRTLDLVCMMTPLGGSTSVPAYEIYQQAFHSGQVGSAAAIGVVITVLAPTHAPSWATAIVHTVASFWCRGMAWSAV